MERGDGTVVLIPAHNEQERIRPVISGVRTHVPGARIVVVDDGSSDHTGDIARSCGATVITLPFNMGVGAALQTGYKYALRRNCEYLVQLDADGQHDPRDIPDLLNALKGSDADMVIGSRFLLKSGFSCPVIRLIGIRLFSGILSLLSRRKLTDPTSGYRAMNHRTIEFFCRDLFPFDYPDADLLLTFPRAGFRIREVPVTMASRESGLSQHRGLRPVYYVLKMALSMFVTLFRRHDM